MGFTPEQIKGRIKSVAKQNNADARTLMRIYMMERFLERLAQSEYRDNFIIKGGILVTAMIGVAHRSTMDIDTSMKNLNLSAEDALRVVNQVKDIDLDDGVSFDVKDVSNIMDEINITVDLILINKIQVFAASVSTLVAFLSMFVIRYIDVNKTVHMKIRKPIIIGSVLIGGMLVGTYYCGNKIIQFVALCITAIYAVLTNVDMLKSGVNLVKSRLGK